MKKYKDTFSFKAITLAVLCLFMVNTVSWALAPQSGFKPLIDDGIEISMQVQYEILAGIRLLLVGKSVDAVNGYLNESNSVDRKIEYIRSNILGEDQVKATFRIIDEKNKVFDIYYVDTRTDSTIGDVSVKDIIEEGEYQGVLKYRDVFQKNDLIYITKTERDLTDTGHIAKGTLADKLDDIDTLEELERFLPQIEMTNLYRNSFSGLWSYVNTQWFNEYLESLDENTRDLVKKALEDIEKAEQEASMADYRRIDEPEIVPGLYLFSAKANNTGDYILGFRKEINGKTVYGISVEMLTHIKDRSELDEYIFHEALCGLIPHKELIEMQRAIFREENNLRDEIREVIKGLIERNEVLSRPASFPTAEVEELLVKIGYEMNEYNRELLSDMADSWKKMRERYIGKKGLILYDDVRRVPCAVDLEGNIVRVVSHNSVEDYVENISFISTGAYSEEEPVQEQAPRRRAAFWSDVEKLSDADAKEADSRFFKFLPLIYWKMMELKWEMNVYGRERDADVIKKTEYLYLTWTIIHLGRSYMAFRYGFLDKDTIGQIIRGNTPENLDAALEVVRNEYTKYLIDESVYGKMLKFYVAPPETYPRPMDPIGMPDLSESQINSVKQRGLNFSVDHLDSHPRTIVSGKIDEIQDMLSRGVDPDTEKVIRKNLIYFENILRVINAGHGEAAIALQQIPPYQLNWDVTREIEEVHHQYMRKLTWTVLGMYNQLKRFYKDNFNKFDVDEYLALKEELPGPKARSTRFGGPPFFNRDIRLSTFMRMSYYVEKLVEHFTPGEIISILHAVRASHAKNFIEFMRFLDVVDRFGLYAEFKELYDFATANQSKYPMLLGVAEYMSSDVFDIMTHKDFGRRAELEVSEELLSENAYMDLKAEGVKYILRDVFEDPFYAMFGIDPRGDWLTVAGRVKHILERKGDAIGVHEKELSHLMRRDMIERTIPPIQNLRWRKANAEEGGDEEGGEKILLSLNEGFSDKEYREAVRDMVWEKINNNRDSLVSYMSGKYGLSEGFVPILLEELKKSSSYEDILDTIDELERILDFELVCPRDMEPILTMVLSQYDRLEVLRSVRALIESSVFPVEQMKDLIAVLTQGRSRRIRVIFSAFEVPDNLKILIKLKAAGTLDDFYEFCMDLSKRYKRSSGVIIEQILIGMRYGILPYDLGETKKHILDMCQQVNTFSVAIYSMFKEFDSNRTLRNAFNKVLSAIREGSPIEQAVEELLVCVDEKMPTVVDRKRFLAEVFMMVIPQRDTSFVSIEGAAELVARAIEDEEDLLEAVARIVPEAVMGHYEEGIEVDNIIYTRKIDYTPDYNIDGRHVNGDGEIDGWISRLSEESSEEIGPGQVVEAFGDFIKGGIPHEEFQKVFEGHLKGNNIFKRSLLLINSEEDRHQQLKALENLMTEVKNEILKPVENILLQTTFVVAVGEKGSSRKERSDGDLEKALGNMMKASQKGNLERAHTNLVGGWTEGSRLRFVRIVEAKLEQTDEGEKGLISEILQMTKDYKGTEEQETRTYSIQQIMDSAWQTEKQVLAKEKTSFAGGVSGRRKISFRVVRSAPYVLWGVNCGVCLAEKYDDLWKDPRFFPMVIFDDETGKVEGIISLYEHVMEDGRRVLLVPGIDPTEELLSKTHPAEILAQSIRVIQELGVKGGYDAVFLPRGRNLRSNHENINKAIDALELEKIPFGEEFRFVGYEMKDVFDITKNDFSEKEIKKLGEQIASCDSLLVKIKRQLKAYPVNLRIDLSTIPREGGPEGFEEDMLKKNMETVARIAAWHSHSGLNIKYILEHPSDEGYRDRAVVALREALSDLSGRSDIDMDCISGEHTGDDVIDIKLGKLEDIAEMSDLGDRVYPIALKETNGRQGVAVPNLALASNIGLVFAALRVAKDTSDEEYMEFKDRVFDRIKDMYSLGGVDVSNLDDNVLDMMVKSENPRTRIEFAIKYALPPAVKMAIEEIQKYYNELQLLLQAA